MTRRRVWMALLAMLVVVAVLCAAGAGGVYVYIQHRNQKWLEAAEAAYARGDWVEARSNYGRYLPQEPSNVPLLLKYADANLHILANRAGALTNAATAYMQVLTYEPENREIREKLLDLYERTGAWLPLEYQTSEWLESEPANETYRFGRALALDKLGRRDEAIAVYEDLIASGTSDMRAYGELARLLRESGRHVQAEQLLDDGLEAHPESGLIHLYRARLFLRTQDLRKGEEALNAALQVAPDNVDVVLAAAQLAVFRHDLDRAVALGEKALSLAPERADSHLAVANIHLNRGDVEGAIAVLAGLKPEVAVDHPETLVTLADLQLTAGQIEEARKTVAFYKNAYPGQQPIVDYFDARELIEAGKAAEAVEKLAPIVKRRPGFLPARYALGVAYLQSGQYDLARSTIEAYVSENPGDLRAQRLLAGQFGRRWSLSEVAARAEQTLEDGEASGAALMSAGLALLEAATRDGEAEAQMPLLERLFEEAIERDGSQVNAYRGWAEALTAAGETERARAVLDRASEAGLDADEFITVRAGIALAEGDVEAART
ncbi:MAG: tetratricopeptide repeat protein, partial [Candidatus Hydrogenedentes bacterium]|nr:tetratricopeptide repeat protein [Candidatus Hydrogenedentota bacterium]